MESLQPEADVPARQNQTPMIIAISAAVLCCCCTIAAIAGSYGYFALRTSEIEYLPTDQTAPEVDESVSEPTPSTDSEVPSDDLGIGEAPIGGLGNEILRNDTWTYVAFASMGQGCDQPISADSTIEVLQEPSNGVWVEKWTVACASGDSYAYEVEYITDDTGATFNIKSLP